MSKILLVSISLIVTIFSIRACMNYAFKDYNLVNLDKIKDSSLIEVKKDTVEFRFFSHPYSRHQDFNALMLIASDDSSFFSGIKEGIHKDSTSFCGGCGMAPFASGQYDHLIITKDASHYIFYNMEDEKNSRAGLIDSDSTLLLLNWKFGSIFFNGDPLPLEEMADFNIYCCSFVDKNFNQILDKGEFKRFTLVFSNLSGLK